MDQEIERVELEDGRLVTCVHLSGVEYLFPRIERLKDKVYAELNFTLRTGQIVERALNELLARELPDDADEEDADELEEKTPVVKASSKSSAKGR